MDPLYPSSGTSTWVDAAFDKWIQWIHLNGTIRSIGMDPLDIQWIHSDGFNESSGSIGSNESIHMDPVDPFVKTSIYSSGCSTDGSSESNQIEPMDPVDPFVKSSIHSSGCSTWLIQWIHLSGSTGCPMDPLDRSCGSTGIQWIRLQILNGSI